MTVAGGPYYNEKVLPVILFWLRAGREFIQEEFHAESETPSLEASYVHAPGS
jgi:hypothetical protein